MKQSKTEKYDRLLQNGISVAQTSELCEIFKETVLALYSNAVNISMGVWSCSSVR